jgi:hypothetical protein
LPYKPGALHPVASAPYKALKCFGLFGLWPKIRQRALADKFKPPALRVVFDFQIRLSPKRCSKICSEFIEKA